MDIKKHLKIRIYRIVRRLRMSQDFGKGKIYKITNDYNDDVYVGSTCDLLTKRFSYHRGDHRKERCKNIPIYKLMNEIGFERFRIELIEEYQCQDKYQLRQREGHFIRELGTLNQRIAGRTRQEDDRKEYNKEYREINKEHYQEIQKKYREINKEHYQEIYKKYKEKNKEQIKIQKSQQILCVCGCITGKNGIARHKQTIKHQELMKTILTPIAD
jgi:group I intron endonuclease